jgi:hypothetical protein
METFVVLRRTPPLRRMNTPLLGSGNGMSTERSDPRIDRLAREAGIAVADLGRRRSAVPGLALHEVRVFDETGGEWSGLVTFSDVADGRETPEELARGLVEVAAGQDGRSPARRLASLPQPIRLFRTPAPRPRGATHTIDRDERGDPAAQAAYREMPEPADGRAPGQRVEGPVEEVLDTYHLPRFIPFPVRLFLFFVAIAIPVLLLWWLGLPHTVAIVVALAFVELVIVFGGLWLLFLSAELTRLPRRMPVQPPSTKGLEDPPGARAGARR